MCGDRARGERGARDGRMTLYALRSVYIYMHFGGLAGKVFARSSRLYVVLTGVLWAFADGGAGRLVIAVDLRWNMNLLLYLRDFA